jgi:hypothetical protein
MSRLVEHVCVFKKTAHHVVNWISVVKYIKQKGERDQQDASWDILRLNLNNYLKKTLNTAGHAEMSSRRIYAGASLKSLTLSG